MLCVDASPSWKSACMMLDCSSVGRRRSRKSECSMLFRERMSLGCEQECLRSSYCWTDRLDSRISSRYGGVEVGVVYGVVGSQW